jgi:transposase
MGLALAAFARAERAGQRKHVVVVVDRAAWHTTPHLPMPRGLHLVSLPAATPELQPAERLWPLLNEGIANRSFPTLGLLERALARRCRQLIEQRALIRNLTCYHWWPD